jgi:serine/threonine-protein kinase
MIAVGGMLGRYEVIKHLAQGGMAEVLLGRTSGVQGFERYVVIKRIRYDQARDEQFVRMFLDEARLAAALHHNNILQVHDIGEEAGEYFITMEYLHGQDLRKLLKRTVVREEMVPLEQVVMIVASAACGLHFAHEHRGPDRLPLGIVHRDVSLSNIMVGYDVREGD